MKLMLAIQDSMGHLLPSIRFAQQAQKLGHEIVAVSSDRHGALLDQSGIPHIPVTNADNPFMSMGDWYAVDVVKTQVRVFDTLVDRLKPDAVVCGPLAISAFMFAERQALPLAVIGYASYLYPGIGDSDETRWWRLRSITGFYNAARAGLGLRPLAADPERTPLIGDCYMLRNVPEFTGPAQLPASVFHVGGLHAEPGAGAYSARAFAERWRDRGRRVVFLQIGRLFGKVDLWPRLTAALDALGLAAIADVGRCDYLPEDAQFPDHCFGARFISLGDVADLVDFILCSGHGASLLGGMSHGKPLACLPTSADSVELAARIAELGLGASLDWRQPTDGIAADLRVFLQRHDAGGFDPALERFGGLLGEWKAREGAVITGVLERLQAIRTDRAAAGAALSA
ncbi:MAG TPA: hypothetical protein VIT45_10535 [Allosphingosinicella sp.]